MVVKVQTFVYFKKDTKSVYELKIFIKNLAYIGMYSTKQEAINTMKEFVASVPEWKDKFLLKYKLTGNNVDLWRVVSDKKHLHSHWKFQITRRRLDAKVLARDWDTRIPGID